VSAASKLAIIDRLLPLVEAFGASRRRQSELRKEMKASACVFVLEAAVAGEQAAPCYSPAGRTPWCEACRRHDQAFAALMAERKHNKRRLHKIEKLSVAYAKPEPQLPPEPKELLELIDHLEQEDKRVETDILGAGDHEEAPR
jgi:hypothetical protein